MKKFVAGLAVVVAFVCILGGSGRIVSATARQATIYNGNVENLISRIVERAKILNGKFFGKSYSTNKDGYKYCAMYFGESKNIYVGFTLNDDYSVIDAYVAVKDGYADDLSGKRFGFLTGLIMKEVGLDIKDYNALWREISDYIDYYRQNNYDFKNFNKTVYKFASSISKNVYLQATSINDEKGGQIVLGVAK